MALLEAIHQIAAEMQLPLVSKRVFYYSFHIFSNLLGGPSDSDFVLDTSIVEVWDFDPF